MPEGDTVRRTAAGLDRALSGRALIRADLRWGSLGGTDLAGRTVVETVAYGKNILTRIAGGRGTAGMMSAGPEAPLTMRSHLRMDGNWSIEKTPGPEAVDGGRTNRNRLGNVRAGVSVRAILANSEWTAVGVWLGMLDLVPTSRESELIGHLGPDLMAPDFLAGGLDEGVRRMAAEPEVPVGSALMDQTNVAGVGTIYMAEALFVQRVSPWTPTGDVDLGALLSTASRLLLIGVQYPISNTTGDSRPGLGTWVHGRSGRACQRCGGTVRVASIGAAPRERPAFYCPSCQPGPAPTDRGYAAKPLGANPNYRENRRPTGYRRR